MLKSVITVVNSGSQGEDVIGKGFHKYFSGNETTTFSIDANLAAAAVAKINAASTKLAASAGAAADDGNDPDVLDYIPYAELGAAGGVAQLDENGLVVDETQHNFSGDGAPTVNDDETEGYSIRSIWLDATSSPREVYRCLNAAEGAAVWAKTTLDLADLGTMAAQDADDVAITGGEAVLDRIGLAVGNNGTKPSAVDNDGVAEEQSPGEAGDLTLDGADVTEGVATFDVPRKVTITSDTLNTGITLTVVGTDENGDAQTEAAITGPGAGATVTTTGWFSTVTQVSVSGAGTNLKVGKGAGLVIIDLDDGNVQKLIVGAVCTIDFQNWATTGIFDSLLLRVDNTDNHTITWTGVDLWGAGAVPGFGAANVEVLEIYTMDGGTTVEAIIKAADMKAA
jgi:hypothetical protein